MKKFTLGMAFTLLIFFVGSAFASMDTLTKAKMEDFMLRAGPVTQVALICNDPNRFQFLEAIMNMAYDRYAETDTDKWLIDMEYDDVIRSDAVRPILNDLRIHVANNTSDAIEACKATGIEIANSLKSLGLNIK